MSLLRETSPQSLVHAGGRLRRRWGAGEFLVQHLREIQTRLVTTAEQIYTLVFAQVPSPCTCEGQESQYNNNNNNNNIRLCSGYSRASAKLVVQNRIFITICLWQIRPWLEGFRLTDKFSQLGYSWQGIHRPRCCPVALYVWDIPWRADIPMAHRQLNAHRPGSLQDL